MPMLLKRRSEKRKKRNQRFGPGKKAPASGRDQRVTSGGHHPRPSPTSDIVSSQLGNEADCLRNAHTARPALRRPIFTTNGNPNLVSSDPLRIRKMKVATREWQPARVKHVRERASFIFMLTNLKRRSRASNWLLHLTAGRHIYHSDTSCLYQSTSFQCSYLVQVHYPAQSPITSAALPHRYAMKSLMPFTVQNVNSTHDMVLRTSG
ncbi:hypothetical protein LZ30DRAFT_15692 [Colletotrichum cereale]|nr:hypothetical protein LZ30DRAFT_15692 [Colletotrichum cereale]